MIRTATTARAASVRESPELRSWVALCEEVRRALDEPLWGSVIRGTAPLGNAAPLLADAVFSIDLARATAWLRHLFTRAAAAGGPAATLRPERLSEEHVRALLGAAIAEEQFEQLAQDVDAEPGALGPVASLGAMPLLHAARRTLYDAVRARGHTVTVRCAAPGPRSPRRAASSAAVSIAALAAAADGSRAGSAARTAGVPTITVRRR